MVSYQVPHRAVETVFCRREPTPENCAVDQPFFDSSYANVPLSSFEVKKSGLGDNAGRGVFTKINIAQDTYLSAETSSQCVLFMPSTVSLIKDLENEPIGHELEALLYYIYGYGYTSRFFVSVADWCHFECRPWYHTEYPLHLSPVCLLIG
jgi:hypothetical protein